MKGVFILQELENGIHSLKEGDEFVYMKGKKRILTWYSSLAEDENIMKVVWKYGVKNCNKYTRVFDEKTYLEQRYVFRCLLWSFNGLNTIK
jgi:hypothetical protein